MDWKMLSQSSFHLHIPSTEKSWAYFHVFKKHLGRWEHLRSPPGDPRRAPRPRPPGAHPPRSPLAGVIIASHPRGVISGVVGGGGGGEEGNFLVFPFPGGGSGVGGHGFQGPYLWEEYFLLSIDIKLGHGTWPKSMEDEKWYRSCLRRSFGSQCMNLLLLIFLCHKKNRSQIKAFSFARIPEWRRYL